MLAATPDKLGLSVLVGDLAQFRNDVTTSAITLVNRGQPSQPNTPMLADMEGQWTTLTTDYDKTWQDIGHVQFAALEMAQEGFNTLLIDLGIGLPDPSPSLAPAAASTSDSIAAASPPHATSVATKKVQPLVSPPPSPPPSPQPTVEFTNANWNPNETDGSVVLQVQLSRTDDSCKSRIETHDNSTADDSGAGSEER